MVGGVCVVLDYVVMIFQFGLIFDSWLSRCLAFDLVLVVWKGYLLFVIGLYLFVDWWIWLLRFGCLICGLCLCNFYLRWFALVVVWYLVCCYVICVRCSICLLCCLDLRYLLALMCLRWLHGFLVWVGFVVELCWICDCDCWLVCYCVVYLWLRLVWLLLT